MLEDINWKAEMKKMDMAATRTMQQIILLVTMGAEPDKGGINQKALEAVSNFFKNESVARVLVADYTTDAKFIIPDIAGFLDPKKYDMVDRDIKEGLNYIIAGQNDKYANASSKIDVFIQRLTQARESFLSEFLIPEIKKISQELGLKNYPLPYFEDIDMKDGLEYNKVYTRLIELGVLTPEEGIEAMQSGKLPDKEESIANQEEFRKLKDKGYYEPLMGGPSSQMKIQDSQFKNQQKMAEQQHTHDGKMKTKDLKHKAENPEQVAPQIVVSGKPGSPAGRPTGAKSKQTTKKPTRIGGSEQGLFSVSKLKNNLIAFSDLNKKVTSEITKKYHAEKLTEEQQELAEQISEIIIANELPESWSQSVSKYIEEPIDTNHEAIKEIQSIAVEHQVNEFMASLLYHSKCQETE